MNGRVIRTGDEMVTVRTVGGIELTLRRADIRSVRRARGFVYELFVASGGLGIGDRAMISGGMSILPGIDLSDQIFYVAPKIQLIATDRVQTAIGAFWARPLTDEGRAGMVFGGVTTGSDRASLSGGLAIPFTSETEFAEAQLVWLGGELHATRRGKLITENWFVPGADAAIVSIGFRIVYETVTVEVAAATTTEGSGILPVVNFSLAW